MGGRVGNATTLRPLAGDGEEDLRTQAVRANIKAIGKAYDIVMRQEDQWFHWKFPHHAEMQSSAINIPAAVAAGGFPSIVKPRRAATERETCVVEDFFRANPLLPRK